MKKIVAILLTLCLLLGFAAVPASAFQLEGYQLVGDVDGDYYITIIDATWLQRYLIEAPLTFTFNDLTADADEDGFVSVIDVTSIQRWLIDAGVRLNLGEEVFPRVDKSTAHKYEGSFSEGSFIICRICQSHIIGWDEAYNTFIRLNGDLPEGYCLGDPVSCNFTNLYEDAVNTDLLEADVNYFYPPGEDPFIAYKPVIYLYPEEETEVDVKLDIDGSFVYTDPAYADGWKITAAPDGTLTDADGKTYPYLFWEARLNAEYDFSEGFCVKGSDTESFLQDALTALGLNENEKTEFIGFWLERLQDNPYNVISFQTSAYTDAAKLSISPQPDTTIRVFMAWYPTDEVIDIPAQTFEAPERQGFTAVEWGGQRCK